MRQINRVSGDALGPGSNFHIVKDTCCCVRFGVHTGSEIGRELDAGVTSIS